MPERLITTSVDIDAGVVVEERHTTSGRLHRDPREGPALTGWDAETRTVALERYYHNGRLHRPDGPAVVEYFLDGRVANEYYYEHGVKHRDPKAGPAEIERRFPEGTAALERYMVNGKPWRDPVDGPYLVQRHADGSTAHVAYSDPSEPRPGRSSSARDKSRSSARFRSLVPVVGLGGVAAAALLSQTGKAVAATGHTEAGAAIGRTGSELGGAVGLLGGAIPEEGTAIRSLADGAVKAGNLVINRIRFDSTGSRKADGPPDPATAYAMRQLLGAGLSTQ